MSENEPRQAQVSPSRVREGPILGALGSFAGLVTDHIAEL
jgi:hypothetical protein